jgi:EAL domain-containing protein (putative c-di-GMP-specific phosphodiesterase class I)
MADPERATAMLEQLGAMGIRVSIDDYGTGHSSLAYLRRLPVQELKIDRSFVQHLASDDEDLQIVRSTIDLAQGFLLVRPVPPDVLLEQLRERGLAIP